MVLHLDSETGPQPPTKEDMIHFKQALTLTSADKMQLEMETSLREQCNHMNSEDTDLLRHIVVKFYRDVPKHMYCTYIQCTCTDNTRVI